MTLAGPRRAAGRRDDGFTLVELCIAMLVTGILTAVVATFVMGTLRTVVQMNTKISTTADARLAVETVSRTLRGAVKPTSGGATSAIVSATASSLTIYSMLQRTGFATLSGEVVPSKVEYYVTGVCLYEATTPGRVVAGTGILWDTGRTAKCILRSTTPPTFTYYATPSSTTPLTLPLADPTGVQSIGISITATDPGNPAAGSVPMTSRLTLDNVVLQKGGTA